MFNKKYYYEKQRFIKHFENDNIEKKRGDDYVFTPISGHDISANSSTHGLHRASTNRQDTKADQQRKG